MTRDVTRPTLPPGDGEPHTPVLLHEVVERLAPIEGATVIDGTFGAGGYARALLDRGATVIGVDRDPLAHRLAGETGLADHPSLQLVEAPFSSLDEVAPDRAADAVVLDIGVSSMQLDRAERGFSFRQDGPLDMRMAATGPTAADAVNGLAPSDLTRVIGLLGEERHASRVSRAIVRARETAPIETTQRLADIVRAALPRGRDRIDPATRTFQGLRIYVNDELNELARALRAAERRLGEGGRLVVVTFHSLEDRIVKRFIAERSSTPAGSRHMPVADAPAPTFAALGKQGAGPSDAEIAANPRARSARIRAAIRLSAPPRADADAPLFDLPPLAAFARTTPPQTLPGSSRR